MSRIARSWPARPNPRRSDGLIDNYCSGKEAAPLPMSPSATIVNDTVFSEDQLKTVLKGWLEAQEWEVEGAWGKIRGIDIHARWETERWIIEAKGGGTLDAMRVNYFLGVLGETLQRMDEGGLLGCIARLEAISKSVDSIASSSETTHGNHRALCPGRRTGRAATDWRVRSPARSPRTHEFFLP